MTAKREYVFEVYEGKRLLDGTPVYHFRFIAANGNIVGHHYNTRRSAEKSLAAFLAAVREDRIERKDQVITDGLKGAIHDIRSRKRVIKSSVK